MDAKLKQLTDHYNAKPTYKQLISKQFILYKFKINLNLDEKKILVRHNATEPARALSPIMKAGNMRDIDEVNHQKEKIRLKEMNLKMKKDKLKKKRYVIKPVVKGVDSDEERRKRLDRKKRNKKGRGRYGSSRRSESKRSKRSKSRKS